MKIRESARTVRVIGTLAALVLVIVTLLAQVPKLENTIKTGDSEIHRLRVADQDDRRGLISKSKDEWDELGRRDSIRLKRAKEIYQSGGLVTAGDYFDAALILQHGSTPDDYLLAHVLCTVAVVKGDTDAAWLSAATLDRYLQSIQRKQIFGTQYDGDETKGYTYEPYDGSLLTDSVRKAVQVPTREEQQKDLQNLNKRIFHNQGGVW